jgi:hypothetical protein
VVVRGWRVVGESSDSSSALGAALTAPPSFRGRENMFENYGTIWVCVDCILHHANGECGSCHDDEHGHDEEPLSTIGDGFHVAMGMAREEHFETEPDDDCDCETNTYSTSQCEGCGSYLHGERHAMTLLKEVSA